MSKGIISRWKSGEEMGTRLGLQLGLGPLKLVAPEYRIGVDQGKGNGDRAQENKGRERWELGSTCYDIIRQARLISRKGRSKVWRLDREGRRHK